jgi:hypothetical protein
LRIAPAFLFTFAIPFAFPLEPAFAAENSGAAEPKPPRFEVYSGAAYDVRGTDLYGDAVWSFGAPVTEPGFRLRAGLLTSIYGSTDSGVFTRGFQPADLGTLYDLMAGYQLNRGDVWVKFYAGAAYQSQMRLFETVGQLTQEQGWGAKAAIETWWNINRRLWTSADVSWLQLNNETSIYYRLGYEILRLDSGLKFSAGTEASADFADAAHFKEGRHLGDEASFIRSGALLNFQYGKHDLTLTGGLAQSSEDAKWGPYATLNYGRKF